MRKSSLYLGLSIIALVAGIAMGEARDWNFTCNSSCPFTCDVKTKTDPADQFYHHCDEAFRMVQTGDYEAMEFHTREILKVNDSPISHSLLAYSLRGQGKHLDSIHSYRHAIELAENTAPGDGSQSEPTRERQRMERAVIADAWIGIAANYAALEKLEEALEAANTAVALAGKRVQENDTEDTHYQLACAYATRSSISESPVQDRRAAIAHLNMAISNGFDNFAHMRGDLDLKPLHDDEKFLEISQ